MARWAPADSPSSARRSGSMPSSPACARTQRSPWRTSSSGARDVGRLAREGHGRPYHSGRTAGTSRPRPLRWGLEQAVARPLIGISSYGRAGQRQTFSLPCEYVDVVRLAGGVPIMLPAVEGDIPEALGAIAALILPGGGDVDPAHYGGARHEA